MPDTPFDAEHYDRLIALADHLAQVPSEHFVMSAWFSQHATGAAMQLSAPFRATRPFATPEAAIADCGTAACVAGQAAGFFKLRADSESDWGHVVADYLGLNDAQEHNLFLPVGYEAHGGKVAQRWAEDDYDVGKVEALFTPANAAKAVRELAQTGHVPGWWACAEVERADDEDGIQND
jgi:hypothetical protein